MIRLYKATAHGECEYEGIFTIDKEGTILDLVYGIYPPRAQQLIRNAINSPYGDTFADLENFDNYYGGDMKYQAHRRYYAGEVNEDFDDVESIFRYHSVSSLEELGLRSCYTVEIGERHREIKSVSPDQSADFVVFVLKKSLEKNLGEVHFEYQETQWTKTTISMSKPEELKEGAEDEVIKLVNRIPRNRGRVKIVLPAQEHPTLHLPT